MRTTLVLSEELLVGAAKLSGIKSKTKLIETALEEFVRKRKRKNIKNAFGKIDLKVDIHGTRKKEIRL